MLSDRYCIRARRIAPRPRLLQCFEIEIVVANADALDEAHMRHEGEEASIHFPMDDKQDFGLRRMLSEVFLTQTVETTSRSVPQETLDACARQGEAVSGRSAVPCK